MPWKKKPGNEETDSGNPVPSEWISSTCLHNENRTDKKKPAITQHNCVMAGFFSGGLYNLSSHM